MSKKGKSKNIADLFIKRAKKKDLPELRVRADIRDARKKWEKLAKYEQEIEKLRAPLWAKEAERRGIDAGTLTDIERRQAEVVKQMRSDLGAPTKMEGSTLGPHHVRPPYVIEGSIDLTGSKATCKEVTVRVCKEWICVKQQVPLHVDDISPAAGSGCTFTKYGDNKFKADDGVNGSSYRSGLNYHRRCKTTNGEINILASGELVEASRVIAMGITYKYFPDPDDYYDKWHMNQSTACGWSRIFLPPSWGRAKKYWDMEFTSKSPGGPAVKEFQTDENILVEDTGKCQWGYEHGCLYGGCWIHNTILGVTNPPDQQVTVARLIDRDFPAGSIFIAESSLSYWAKACGEGGGAGVCYGLEILPFLIIEACSYQYPDSVTVPLSEESNGIY